jgi:HK97 family phage prohead protease
MLKRYAAPAALTLGDLRQVRAIASTEDVGRDGLIVRTAGIDLTNFTANPVILFDHDPAKPIARAASVKAEGGKLVTLIQFPDEDVSAQADEVYGLVRAGVLNTLSIGFEVLEGRTITVDGNPVREIVRCELGEISIVSVPALPSALVTERAQRTQCDADLARHLATAERYRRELGIAAPVKRKPLERRSMEFHRAMAAVYERELAEGHQR